MLIGFSDATTTDQVYIGVGAKNNGNIRKSMTLNKCKITQRISY
jgi:hypothetical protein